MILQKHKDEIIKLCKAYSVKNLFAFGSVLRDDFSESSDIDFVVEIDANDPLVYAENYFGLKFKLEELFGRPVDLLEERALKNQYLIQSINQSKSLIYAA